MEIWKWNLCSCGNESNMNGQKSFSKSCASQQPHELKTQFPWEKYLCLRLGSWSKKKNRERQSFITDRRKRVEGGLATTHRRDGAKRFFRPSPSHSPFVPAGARTLKTLLMSSNSLVYCSPESYLLGLWPNRAFPLALKSPIGKPRWMTRARIQNC